MSADLVSVPLYRLGHGRSGDKGDISNLSLIAWDPECYAILAAQVSEARVAAWFASRHPRRVVRYLLPTLHAMNFVLENALDGGVNDALNLDAHGKSLSFRLLDMTVQVSPRWPPVCPTYPATAQRPPDPPTRTHTGDTRCARPSGPGSPCCWRRLPLAASAQSFPAKPITFIVPFAAGSATDQIGRAIGQGVTEQTGQAVVIENKPGASAMIGARRARRARRLYRAHHHQHHARRQPASVQDADLPAGGGLRAADAAGQGRPDHGGQSEFGGQERRRLYRAGAPVARQAQLRQRQLQQPHRR